MSTFEEYGKRSEERQAIFSKFTNRALIEGDVLNGLRLALMAHLSQSIIVKESRNRYQEEQFQRFLASQQNFLLGRKNQSLENFCMLYSEQIEFQVTKSHNGLSPHIAANYGAYEEETIKPLNGVFMYLFFSATRGHKLLAKFLLTTFQFPNEALRRAYLRFFTV
uniref:Uncharacterized protein n=1 Tax=Strombidium rassoulzadegani TaxID=1082188 RepID=A0A7S3FZ57_9SPIT|mmetsp:Transcript_8479/g.14250  ORF Transcript_8479/g.14250 Transcript_8479/m.14250 type:complete len:165 (+) Transcript_8479:915-1409(+)